MLIFSREETGLRRVATTIRPTANILARECASGHDLKTKCKLLSSVRLGSHTHFPLMLSNAVSTNVVCCIYIVASRRKLPQYSVHGSVRLGDRYIVRSGFLYPRWTPHLEKLFSEDCLWSILIQCNIAGRHLKRAFNEPNKQRLSSEPTFEYHRVSCRLLQVHRLYLLLSCTTDSPWILWG